MESHYTKVALSALGVVAMLTNFTFAQKQQYISHVNQSGLFELLKAAAAGRELPQYEVVGFPISAHQMSVLQSGGIEEQPLTPMLTLQGMPASPHQIAVIGFRTKQYARAEIGGRAIFDLGPQ
jgi:hypothetical protein